MQSSAPTPAAYIAELPEERKKAMQELRKIINKNLPKGFKEIMGYGMLSYVVPHSLYPAGYHCKPEDPLPFMALASQKNFIAVYHMGIYGDQKLQEWFTSEYIKATGKKPDMGKSCIRFKKPELIPFDLIGELSAKMTSDEWIKLYEKNLKK